MVLKSGFRLRNSQMTSMLRWHSISSPDMKMKIKNMVNQIFNKHDVVFEGGVLKAAAGGTEGRILTWSRRSGLAVTAPCR